MDAPNDPLSLDSAPDFIAASLRLLEQGVHDRRSAFRVISLATTGLGGTPHVRSVVLRGLDISGLHLTFHTDKRSAKFAELLHSPQAAALAYNPDSKLQLRLSGKVTMHYDDLAAAGVWNSMQAMARACYHVPNPPGSALAAQGNLSEAEARSHFTVCTLNIQTIDVLYLRAAGHLRAIGSPGGGEIMARWVTP